jgi:hypothetical protein
VRGCGNGLITNPRRRAAVTRFVPSEQTRTPHQGFFNSSGSFAKLAASRRASLMGDHQIVPEIEGPEALPVGVIDREALGVLGKDPRGGEAAGCHAGIMGGHCWRFRVGGAQVV